MKTIFNLALLLLRAWALWLGLLAVAGAAATFAGHWDARLDIASHLSAVWLLLGAVGAVASVVLFRGSERWVSAGVGVAGMILVLAQSAPEIAPRAEAPPPTRDEQRLKVIQFNVWAANTDPEGSAAWVIAQDPDIVVAEETFDAGLPVLQALKRHYRWSSECKPLPACATAVLSKQKPTAHGDFVGGWGDAYLPSAWAQFGEGADAFTVIGVHYVRPTSSDRQGRQLRRLLTAIDGLDRSSLILAGDFNLTPWSAALKRQDKAFGLERRTRLLPTWPGRFEGLGRITPPVPLLPIDHVYAGADWRTLSVRRGPRLGSDHYPVVVELARPR